MKTMKALVLRDIGSLDKMSYEDVEFPIAKAGEAIVRIKAAALNHRDLWIILGLYAKIKVPVILGSDAPVKLSVWGTKKIKVLLVVRL